MSKKSFFAELKRRTVYRSAVAYGVVGWLIIQIATQVFPFLDIPNWVTKVVIVLLLLGFPVALFYPGLSIGASKDSSELMMSLLT